MTSYEWVIPLVLFVLSEVLAHCKFLKANSVSQLLADIARQMMGK